MGEVAERSEDGEGKLGCSTLSVTFGDSAPRGRAKGLYRYAPLTVLRPLSKRAAAGFTNLKKGHNEKNLEYLLTILKKCV